MTIVEERMALLRSGEHGWPLVDGLELGDRCALLVRAVEERRTLGDDLCSAASTIVSAIAHSAEIRAVPAFVAAIDVLPPHALSDATKVLALEDSEATRAAFRTVIDRLESGYFFFTTLFREANAALRTARETLPSLFARSARERSLGVLALTLLEDVKGRDASAILAPISQALAEAARRAARRDALAATIAKATTDD